MGASWEVSDAPYASDGGVTGASNTPMTPPMVFFSKNKNYHSNQMHSFFPRTKITWGVSCVSHDAPMLGGIRHPP